LRADDDHLGETGDLTGRIACSSWSRRITSPREECGYGPRPRAVRSAPKTSARAAGAGNGVKPSAFSV
jgi:hypothetical protein